MNDQNLTTSPPPGTADRARQKNQRACVVWFTGLSGAGKTSTARALEQHLYALGYHSYLLDGDNVRHGLNRDLGFSDADRTENIRRVAEVASLFTDAGLIVLASFISPFRRERETARRLAGGHPFVEVYMATALAVCEQRDPKGLYKKARRGELAQFTGIDSAYEAPERAELVIDSAQHDIAGCADQVMAYLLAQNIVQRDRAGAA